ncbi:MAG: pitrilysin family protein [Nocardioides sp.]
MTSKKSTKTGRQATAGRSSVSALSSSQPAGSTRTLQRLLDDEGRVVSRVRRTVLPSGLRIITEDMAGVRSASVGVWVGVGSRDESPRLHGCSHFLEHLLFKGTPTRSALEISAALDEVGGDFNAYTAKEYTCFHARVLDEDLPVALDVLGDMLTSSVISPADVEAEREVILDEIAMHDDDPDDVVHNLFAAAAWGDSPLGRPIAGTTTSIEALTREQIVRFYRRHYVAAKMAISVAGNVDHDAVVRQVKRAFSGHGFLNTVADPSTPRVVANARPVARAEATSTRAFEQVNLVLGMRGLTRSDPRRFALGVLNTALGGGTSSRLFQEVREQRGLAYGVYSFATSHADAGMVGVSVGCLPSKVEAVLDVVRAELAKIAADGITEDELRRGQGQLTRGLIMGMEDSGARMSRLGKAEILEDRLLSFDAVVAGIEGVTLDDVRALAADLFARPEVLAVVGPAR